MSTPITVACDAFAEGQMIPSLHTCDGQDIHRGSWSLTCPQTQKRGALLCDDPDAPGGDWVHWLVFNLPPALTELAQASPRKPWPAGGATGRNSWGNARYQGPCPPSGTHRYFFKVFALDLSLDLPAGAAKSEFLAKAKGHSLAQGMLMGRYERHH